MEHKQFVGFYQFPTTKKLQELIASGNLTDANIYDLLEGYKRYQEKQISYDSPN